MTSSQRADCIVLGGGIVGLAAARALATRGATVLLSAPSRIGIASRAAAGVLGPTVDPAPGTAYRFACDARDGFPSYAGLLLDESGIDIELDIAGILRVAISESDEHMLRAKISNEATWLDADEVAELEPVLAPCRGALFHPQDGMVANERLHSALAESVHRNGRVAICPRPAVDVAADDVSARVRLEDGAQWEAPYVVIATGAWTSTIPGVPRLSIEPVRGQMLVVAGIGPRRPVYGARGYLTPRRDGRVLAGSTLERVGFDASTTSAELDRLEGVARTLVPSLSASARVASWAGLRPFTPDGLPILGWSPSSERMMLAAGHSKNGVLMGPLTGEVVADLVIDGQTSHDLSLFSPSRFG